MLEVLMIEDDVELAEIITSYLGQYDMNVTNYDEPYTGMSAVNAKHFDILLLDLTLPNLDGLEVCKRVAKQNSIPIIVSSARSDVDDKVEALKSGADDYISKPYDPKELVVRIQTLLRRCNKKSVKEQDKEDAVRSSLFFFNNIRPACQLTFCRQGHIILNRRPTGRSVIPAIGKMISLACNTQEYSLTERKMHHDIKIQREKAIYRIGGCGAGHCAGRRVFYPHDNGSAAQHQPALCDRHDHLCGGQPGDGGDGGDQAGGVLHGYGQ